MNPNAMQQQAPGCEESSLGELKDALQHKREESEELARSAKRCEAHIEQLNSALGEIQQNIAAFTAQAPKLRKDWADAVRDWRCLWDAVRHALDCNDGPNCKALRACIKYFDKSTKDLLLNELCPLRDELAGELQTELDELNQDAALSREAYTRLLVDSIQKRIEALRATVTEAEQYNTGVPLDAAKAYVILLSAKELIAGVETNVVLCPEAESTTDENEGACQDSSNGFVIPATPQLYERDLIAAFRKLESDFNAAAVASDALAAKQAKREVLEAEILKRLTERKQNLLEVAQYCELPCDDDTDDRSRARDPRGHAAAR
jgi:phage shock protein A